jgi:hypothetical protein
MEPSIKTANCIQQIVKDETLGNTVCDFFIETERLRACVEIKERCISRGV